MLMHPGSGYCLVMNQHLDRRHQSPVANPHGYDGTYSVSRLLRLLRHAHSAAAMGLESTEDVRGPRGQPVAGGLANR